MSAKFVAASPRVLVVGSGHCLTSQRVEPGTSTIRNFSGFSSTQHNHITALEIAPLQSTPSKKKIMRFTFSTVCRMQRLHTSWRKLYRNASYCCTVPPVGGSVVLGDVFLCSAGGFSHGLGLALLLRIFHYEEPQVFKNHSVTDI